MNLLNKVAGFVSSVVSPTTETPNAPVWPGAPKPMPTRSGLPVPPRPDWVGKHRTYPDIVVIDLETAGLAPDSVIYTIGATRFNYAIPADELEEHLVKNALYLWIDPKTQPHSKTCTKTAQWLQGQAPKVQQEIDKCHLPAFAMPIEVALKQLADYVKPTDVVYARGQEFERDLLTTAGKLYNVPFFRKYNQIFDVRSNIQTNTGYPDGNIDLPAWMLEKYTRHVAIDDCIMDAMQMYMGHHGDFPLTK